MRDLVLLWLSDEYHHSRNCRKKTPMEREVERAMATPLAACDISCNVLFTRLQTHENALLVVDFITFFVTFIPLPLDLKLVTYLCFLILINHLTTQQDNNRRAYNVYTVMTITLFGLCVCKPDAECK